MKENNIFEAVGDVGGDLIEAAFTEDRQKKTGKKTGRVILIVAVLAVIVISVFAVVMIGNYNSGNNKEPDQSDKGGIIDSETMNDKNYISAGDPVSDIKIIVMTKESAIKLGEDLQVVVCCYTIDDYDSYDPAPEKVSARLMMSDGRDRDVSQPDQNMTIIRLIDDFTKSAYSLESQKEDVIVIPAEMFTEKEPDNKYKMSSKEGAIVWMVEENIIYSEEFSEYNETHSHGYSLYYRIEDDNVFLYGSYYDFFNDIRNKKLWY